jgi:hypothetical protein
MGAIESNEQICQDSLEGIESGSYSRCDSQVQPCHETQDNLHDCNSEYI